MRNSQVVDRTSMAKRLIARPPTFFFSGEKFILRSDERLHAACSATGPVQSNTRSMLRFQNRVSPKDIQARIAAAHTSKTGCGCRRGEHQPR